MPTTPPHDTDPDDGGNRTRGGRPAPGSGSRTPLRRPYPTATTTTRLSPARPAGGEPAQRTSTRTRAAVPASVWTFDTAPAGPSPAPGRLVPILERVVTSFASPGATIAVLPWPFTPGATDHTDGLAISAATGAAMVAAVRAAGYAARMIAASAVAAPAGRFAGTDAAGEGTCRVEPLANRIRPSSLDLIVTATGPGGIDEPSADTVALVAARALRAGGILAVLTHSHQRGQVLQDRTGTVVTAGQNADLLYLQHVVAVHGPVHHLDAGPAAGSDGRHQLVHDDLLVLVQPRDHALDLANAAAA